MAAWLGENRASKEPRGSEHETSTGQSGHVVENGTLERGNLGTGSTMDERQGNATPTDAVVEDDEARVYTCRMCRRVVFAEAEVESHQAAQQHFHRRKVMVHLANRETSEKRVSAVES